MNARCAQDTPRRRQKKPKPPTFKDLLSGQVKAWKTPLVHRFPGAGDFTVGYATGEIVEEDERAEDPQYLVEVKFHDGDAFPMSVEEVNKALLDAKKASFASLIRKHPVADVKKTKSPTRRR